MAVLALALQAGSNGYVQACPMKMSAMSATHSCCHACHGATRKACCFLGVLAPCADGAVSEARVTRPSTQVVAVAAAPAAMTAWAALDVPIATDAPPIPTVSPPRTAILLI